MKKTENKGFTFIELVLYIGILSVFMVAVTTLIGSVVASNRKMTSRKKIQTQAEEAYDTMSDMLMAATDVKIYAKAKRVGETSSKEGVYLVPDASDLRQDDGSYKEGGGNKTVQVAPSSNPASGSNKRPCYNIGELDKDVALSTGSTTVGSKTADKLYIKLNYASGLDSTTGDSEITSCTLLYDKTNKKLYAYRMKASNSGGGSFIDSSNDEACLLAKNVEQFDVKVNPDEDSFAITMKLQDAQTAASYTVDGVVSLRNSNVLKAHSN